MHSNRFYDNKEIKKMREREKKIRPEEDFLFEIETKARYHIPPLQIRWMLKILQMLEQIFNSEKSFKFRVPNRCLAIAGYLTVWLSKTAQPGLTRVYEFCPQNWKKENRILRNWIKFCNFCKLMSCGNLAKWWGALVWLCTWLRNKIRLV